MYFRAGSDVTDLSLDENSRIDGFESFDRFFGLPHILLERQRGSVEDDGIKPASGSFDGLHQGMCMICVEKNREIEIFPQTLNQSRNLTDSHKLALALGRTNEDRDLQFLRGGEHRLQ